jgi:hypothetical protein
VRFDSAAVDATMRQADSRQFMLALTQGTRSRSIRSLLASLAYTFPPGSDPTHDAAMRAVHDSFRSGARQRAMTVLVRHLLATERRVPPKSQLRIRALVVALGITDFTAAEVAALRGTGRRRPSGADQAGQPR